MAGNIFNEKDSMDINELASLNEDISPELIEQLQQKIALDAVNLTGNTNIQSALLDDAALFEEPQETVPPISEVTSNEQEQSSTAQEPEKKSEVNLNKSFDDNFIKKYKAKLKKQGGTEEVQESNSSISDAAFASPDQEENSKPEEDISKLSHGNIIEKPFTAEQRMYNDSLDFLDGNVKYSKYVIYIDPQNVEFIESLTVKERKNLINKVIKEQDDISITKHRFQVMQTIIKHVIVAILTITISIPIIFWTINASLEASINNYRRSQSNFQTLYKEKGKIRLHNLK